MGDGKRAGWGLKVAIGVLVLLVAGAWGAREVYRVKKSVSRESIDTYAQRFHQQMDAGQLQEIIDQADAGFREGKTPDELRQRLEEVRARLGRHRSSKLKVVQINYSSKLGKHVVATYESEFEKGRAGEDFTLLVSAGGLRLYGYQINTSSAVKP